MKKDHNPPSDAAELRRRAEERLKEMLRGWGSETPETETEAQRLILELQIHQIELEMQNEELKESRAELEALLERYTDLYDFAPVGYFTLGHEGEIRQVNLTGGQMLGKERAGLVSSRFGRFVSEADRPIFNNFLKTVFTNCSVSSVDRAACEVALSGHQHDLNIPQSPGMRRRAAQATRYVHIEGIATEDGQECRAVVTDITERKRAEEELRESEEKYRLLFDGAQDGMALGDAKTGVLADCNQALCRMVERDRTELLGQNQRVLHPQHQLESGHSPSFRKHKTGDPGMTIEDNLLSRSGKIIPVEIRSAKILMKGRDYLLGIFRDISERKRAEEALITSQRRFSDIIEFLPDATLVIDKAGKVIAWNRAIEIMTGVKAKDMLGKGDYEYALPFYGERRPILIDLALHPEPEREKSYTHIQRMGDILFGEAYTPGLIGGKTHLSATASVLRDAEGEIVAAIECIRDDTERRQTQENLKQAEERYRSIFENAQEGIYRSTPEGRIIMANQAMANMFGYKTPEEFITDVTDVASQFYVHPEERTKLKEIIEDHGSVRNHETQFYRKDGTTFWVSVTMQGVRDPNGQIIYYDGIDEDITIRKEADERMRKSLGATVQAIAVTVETRDPYTAGHQRKVADLSRAIATEMKLDADRIDGIRMAASIHDLGKISVPAEILSNPKRLTPLEFGLIRTHAQSGYCILKDIEFPWPVARMIREHHERMDGSGYPQGLKGEEILLESRILAVADVVEAMASYRPYRPAIGLDAALAEIENNKGTLYDANAVDACLRLFREKGFQLGGA